MPAGESPAARLGEATAGGSGESGRLGLRHAAPGSGRGTGGGPGAACPPGAAASPLRRCSAGPGAACRAGRGRPGLVRSGGRGAGRAMQPGERCWARSLAGQPSSSGWCCVFHSRQHVGSSDAGVRGWVSCTQGAAVSAPKVPLTPLRHKACTAGCCCLCKSSLKPPLKQRGNPQEVKHPRFSKLPFLSRPCLHSGPRSCCEWWSTVGCAGAFLLGRRKSDPRSASRVVAVLLLQARSSFSVAIVITEQPVSVSVPVGYSFTLRCRAEARTSLQYQWFCQRQVML